MLMDDTPEDRAAIQPVINQIVAYPLKDFDGKMKSKDWSKAPAIPGPDPLSFLPPVLFSIHAKPRFGMRPLLAE